MNANRTLTTGPVVAALLATALVSAQNPGPPDIAAEWRLDANERDLTSQAPLGDYTGIPFNDAGRLRSDTTPESIWGTRVGSRPQSPGLLSVPGRRTRCTTLWRSRSSPHSVLRIRRSR